MATSTTPTTHRLYALDVTAADAVAWDRAETDPCEKGTAGCSVRHQADEACQPW